MDGSLYPNFNYGYFLFHKINILKAIKTPSIAVESCRMPSQGSVGFSLNTISVLMI